MSKVTEWPNRIHRDEFQYPDLIDNSVINLAGTIRQRTGKSMYFTKSRSGQVYHPAGDARFPDNETRHFSLHHAGIDHIASYKQKRIIESPEALARAIDFHMKFESMDEFFDVAIDISGIVGDGGFGIYPNWKQPGFHIDTRGPLHPATGARWYAYYDAENVQKYPAVTSWMNTFDTIRSQFTESFA